MLKTFCLLLLIVASSCSLFDGFRKREFIYTDNNTTQKITLLVPKGFNDEKKIIDSAGNQQQIFSYDDGAFLYFAFIGDSTKEYQPIMVERHVARMHPGGGFYYKKRDSTGLYWRELRKDNFRAGYKNVSPEVEEKFDSAVNYAGFRRR